MHAASPSRFSRWWDWLIGQFSPQVNEPSPSPRLDAPAILDEPALAEIISFPGVTEPFAPSESTPEAVRVSQEELIQTLLDTVQQATLPAQAQAVARLYAPERTRTLAKLSNLQQIPSLASLARSFAQAINRDDASVADVVEAVQKDPALCVRVLRLANSVMVSPVERIDDIMSAVQMLGVIRVRKAAHALFTLRDAKAVAAGFDWRHLWVHGLATAAVAEELEKLLGLPQNPQLYLAALLHDIGKIVLSTVSPDTYRTLLIDAWNGTERLDRLEEARLGIGHSEAGVIFAEHCRLHPEIIATIAHHADPASEMEYPLPVALVSLSNYICKAYGLGFSGARLDESDGELETHISWAIIAQHRGSALDLEGLTDSLMKYIPQLKAELKTMREE